MGVLRTGRLIGCLVAVGMQSMGMAEQLIDKTLVVWAAPKNLTQRAGSALTLDDGQTHFDGIVFGEIAERRWMAGSDMYSRTNRDQSTWQAESNKGFVQVAIVYRGRQITLYRNGVEYAHYTSANPLLKFGDAANVLFGRRHLDAKDPENSFIGRIKDARIYNQPLDPKAIAQLQPGTATGGIKPWAWWSFADKGLIEQTGRFTEMSLIGDVKLEKDGLLLGGKGATLVCRALGSGSTTKVPGQWMANGAVPDEVVQSTRLLREKLLADPTRPGYHFCVPEDQGMPGDPNGAFYSQGRYHLMYLYNRTGSGFCWGHISSADLIHWRHHPDAIGPGTGDDGCFSGGAYVDTDGAAYLSYWMLWGAKGIGLAKSTDTNFDHWIKSPSNPVIKSTEWGVTEIKGPSGKPIYVGSADPSNIWKKDGHYYMLTGSLAVLNKVGRNPDSPLSEQGDRLYLFESTDLKKWNYKHVFYERNTAWTDRSEDDMCPSFLPLPSGPGGGTASGKHLLLFISHNKGCQYYVGDYRDDHFFPNNHGRMTWVDNTYFAPEALIDGKGRQIMWAWLTDNPSGEKDRGWSGVYGLPRTLWLGEDGTLRMAPAQELEMLRGRSVTMGLASDTRLLHGIDKTSCEIETEWSVGPTSQCGLNVRASSDGKEFTRIYFDATTHELVFDATHSGGDGRMVVERAPLTLKPEERLKLRIFIDKSVIEVFANDRQAIGRRVYPVGPDSTGITTYGNGEGVVLHHLRGWTMNPSNPY